MVDKERLAVQIRAEQIDFADLARGLTDEQWATSSLCEGWTVRDAVVHTAWHIHLQPMSYVKDVSQFVAFGGAKFDAKQRGRDGARSNESLIDWLASPAGASQNNLGELIVHQQDVRRPLGLSRAISPDRLAWALSYSVSPYGGSYVGLGCGSYKRTRDLHLIATDIGWSGGHGLEIRGPGEAILMAINGRGQAVNDLEGPGVEVLAARLPAHAYAA